MSSWLDLRLFHGSVSDGVEWRIALRSVAGMIIVIFRMFLVQFMVQTLLLSIKSVEMQYLYRTRCVWIIHNSPFPHRWWYFSLISSCVYLHSSSQQTESVKWKTGRDACRWSSYSTLAYTFLWRDRSPCYLNELNIWVESFFECELFRESDRMNCKGVNFVILHFSLFLTFTR